MARRNMLLPEGLERNAASLRRTVGSSLAVLAIAVASYATMASHPARADDQQLQLMEDQIRQLQAQIDALKKTQAAQAAAAAAPSPIGSNKPAFGYETGSHQFGWVSADGQNSIELTGRLMFDAADYFNVKPKQSPFGAGSPGSKGLVSGINARRDRLGITGKFAGDWQYTAIADFGGTSDATATNASAIENAYITYNGMNDQKRDFPVAFDLGYMDINWTLAEAISSNDIMFIERSSSQVVATAMGAGDNRSGIGFRAYKPNWFVDSYFTGPTSGAAHTNAVGDTQQYAWTLRGTYNPYMDSATNASVHIGGNFLYLLAQPHPQAANGFTGTLTLSDRPELRVDTTAILTTGAIPAKSGWIAGPELAAGYGGFYADAEYYHIVVNQMSPGVNPNGIGNASSPSLGFNGGYLQASYTIGGMRKYNASSGAYTGVIPDHPLSMKEGGGWGALELAARYSYIDLNSHWTQGVRPDVTGGVNGGISTGIDVGMNYYPYQNLKFMLDYIHTDISHKYGATTATVNIQTGATVQAIAARAEVYF